MAITRRVVGVLAGTPLAVTTLFLLAVYLCVASVLAERYPLVLAGWGIDPLYVYGHWVLCCLGGLLCVNLMAASMVRIPLDLPRAGAWCSHIGVLVLAGGIVAYGAASQRGTAFTYLQQDVEHPEHQAWSPIDRFYVEHTIAIHSWSGDEEATAGNQTILPMRLPGMAGSWTMDVALTGMPTGLTARVVRLDSNAVINQEWRDDSPVRTPAVELEVRDGDNVAKIVLCPRITGDMLRSQNLTVRYTPDVAPEELREVVETSSQPTTRRQMPHDAVWVVTGDAITPTLLILRADGSAVNFDFPTGRQVTTAVGGRTVSFRAVRYMVHARLKHFVETAAPDNPRGVPVAIVQLRQGDWSQEEPLQYESVPSQDSARVVTSPGGATVSLSFAPVSAALGATLEVLTTKYETYPGSHVPKDYICQVRTGDGDGTISLNNPLKVGPYQVSQNSWYTPTKPQTIIFGVASRPGLPIVWAGIFMICAGLPWAFYVKPLLLRRRGTP